MTPSTAARTPKDRVLELKEVWDFGIILANLHIYVQDLSSENRRRGSESTPLALERILAGWKKCKLEISSIRIFCKSARYIRSWDLLDGQANAELTAWAELAEKRMNELREELNNSNWGKFAARCDEFEALLAEADVEKKQKIQLLLEELRECVR